MIFESGFFLILLGVAALIVLFIVPKTINWLVGRTVIPMWLAAIFIPGALLAGSLFLDSAGAMTPVKVVDKREAITNGKYGSWNRTLSVQINYQSPREPIPTQMSAQMSVSCDAETFDSLHVGQTIQARVLEFGQIFKFARLGNQSTFSWIAGFLPRTPKGPWRETSAAVSYVKEVTQYTDRSVKSNLRWPFNVVELSFIPEGRRETVVAVDVIDAASIPGLKKGDMRAIRYAVDDPRSARIIGARPGAAWMNWLYAMGQYLAIALAFLALIAGFSFLTRRRIKLQARALP